MQAKNKIVILAGIVMMIAASCGVSRRAAEAGRKVGGEPGFFMYGNISENNISGDGIFVRRGRVESYIGGERDRFTINVRITADGKWLVSVRSFAAIEVARIYADKSGVTILDRLGRTATVRNWSALGKEFGLSYEMLPLIIGDVPENRSLARRRIDCSSEVPVDIPWGNLLLKADCGSQKAASMVVREHSYGNEIRIESFNFKTLANGKSYPNNIEVTEKRGLFQMKITLEDVESSWNGSVDFEIPAGYKIDR